MVLKGINLYNFLGSLSIAKRRCLAVVNRKDFVPTLQQAFYNRSVTADDVVQFDIDRKLIV